MTKLSNSYFRRQIEQHFDEIDLDVVVRKRRRAYAIYWHDDEPLARLRPTGRDDEVEVYSWANDRWEREEIDVPQSLDEALEYITDDPANRFFDNGSGEDSVRPTKLDLQETTRFVRVNFMVSSMVGAAVAGLFSGVWSGLVVSAAVAAMVCTILVTIALRISLLKVAASMVVAPFACIGGITAGAVNGGLGESHWSMVCGVLAGFLCSWMLFRGRVLAWSAGLLAGLNLAIALLEFWHVDIQFGSLLFVAFVAAAAADVCRIVMIPTAVTVRADPTSAE